MQSSNFELLLCILRILFDSELLLAIVSPREASALLLKVSLFNGVRYHLTLSQPEY